ncbi:MAG: MFS transporter [Eggerthellaceae bacterium]|nr:MFS transporter [Eggerthellaceae bacterium]MDR2715664.1 MFS transporter [Coriobacteriaceae bacterium]
MFELTKKQKNVLAAWIVVIIAFLGGLALANVQNKVPPVMQAIMAYFDIGYTEAGWLTSIFTIMGMVTAIPASWLLHKLGPKNIGVISLACAAVGSLIGVFSDNLALLMASRVIEGIGVGIIAVVGPAVIAMWFPPEKRGLPMGLWGSWMMASQTILFLIAGGITTAFGWQGVWWFTLGFSVLVLILYMWKVDAPGVGLANFAEAEDKEKYSFAEGFKSPSSWLLSAVGVIFTFCCFGFATYIAVYWGETFFLATTGDIELAQYEGNLWVSLMYAIEIPIVILIGWVLNRTKLHKRKYVGAVGFFLYAVILFFCFRMDAIGLLIPFIIVYPFLEGSIPTVYWTVCPSTAKSPEHAGTALGVLNVGLNIGTLLGPPLTGWMIENYGWQEATIPLAAAAVLGGILMCLVKTYDKRAQ